MTSNIDFIPIPVYKLTNKINEYTYGIDFKSCIAKDEERVTGFIVINDHIIGFLSGFFRNDKWHPSPLEIFAKQSPLREAFESMDVNMKRDVFTVNRLGSLWYTTNGITYVYDVFKKSFIPAENFIKEQVTLPELKKYYLDEECFK